MNKKTSKLPSIAECMDTFNKALVFAIKAHNDQKYDDLPYIVHPILVSQVGTRFGHLVTDPTGGLQRQVAMILHDVIEDTKIEYKDVASTFGERIAEIVFCVTDEMGRNRKERHEKTYVKVRGNPDAIVVKLCDRIANVEIGLASRSRQLDMYRREHAEFKKALDDGVSNREMWDYLDQMLVI